MGHGGKSPLTLLETIGTGCAVLDYDGDGHADLFLVGQPMGLPWEKPSAQPSNHSPAEQTGRCRLYHNNGAMEPLKM